MMRLQFFHDLFFVCSSGPKRSRNDLGVSCRDHACVANVARNSIFLQQFVQHRLQKRTLDHAEKARIMTYLMIRITVRHVCTNSSADLQHGLQIGSN